MAELTLEQRAARRATRHNNRAARELPLLAGTPAIAPFLTTADDQLLEVVKRERAGEEYIERLKACAAAMAERAAEYRRQLEALLPADELATADAYLQDMASRWPAFTQPEYQADYWGEILRKAQSLEIAS